MKKRPHFAVKILVDETGKKAIEETDAGLKITMVASVPAPDRSDETIQTTAWKWRDDPLPKLHWGHQTKNPEMVIGKLTRVWIDGERLMIDAELADKVPGHKMAQLVAGLVRNGDVDQGSVGFIPEAWTEKNGRKVVGVENYTGPRAGRVYTACELYEFSLTTVPDQAKSILTRVQSLHVEEELAVKALADAVGEAPEETASESKPAEKAIARDWLDELLKPAAAIKAGAVLSAANKDKLNSAMAALEDVETALEAAEAAVEAAETAISAVLGTATPADTEEAA